MEILYNDGDTRCRNCYKRIEPDSSGGMRHVDTGLTVCPLDSRPKAKGTES